VRYIEGLDESAEFQTQACLLTKNILAQPAVENIRNRNNRHTGLDFRFRKKFYLNMKGMVLTKSPAVFLRMKQQLLIKIV
jgi:hypothetical protein